MEKIVLFIKTYKKDYDRVALLIDSIHRYNVDKIPLLISVNDVDFDFFRTKFPNENLIKDSQIVDCKEKDPWRYQQIIKSQLHKLDFCENYVCIDSDSYFIRNFGVNDFMFDSETPYTVMHQQKDLFSWSSINNGSIGYNPKNEFEKDRSFIMDKLQRKGVFYDFGPSPVIWSNKVWKSLEDNYLKPNKMDFSTIIHQCPSEFSWYGEWLLKDKTIPIYPIEPLFKVFHYEKQYTDFMKQGHTEDSIKENYLGIVKQSNWKLKRKKWYNKFF
jgi:hypothetical protein